CPRGPWRAYWRACAGWGNWRRRSSVGRQRLPARHGHRLEPGVRPHRVEQVADVVADGLSAEVQILSDLRGRTPSLELAQDLGLAGSEAEIRVGLRFLDQVRHLAEDADHVVAPGQRHGADLDGDAAALL